MSSYSSSGVCSKQPIPRLQHQALGAVLAELAEFVVYEHAEGFAAVIGAHQVGGIEDVAQYISSETVEVGVVGVEFGSEQGAALGIEDEGWAVVAEILGPGLEVMAGVGEFEDAGVDEGDCGGVVGGWREKRKPLQMGMGECPGPNRGEDWDAGLRINGWAKQRIMARSLLKRPRVARVPCLDGKWSMPNRYRELGNGQRIFILG